MLLSVLLITAVAGAIAVSLLLLGVGSSRTSFAFQQSIQARGLADACAEEALQRLRESVWFSGGETLTLTSGTCEIQAIAGTGNSNRTIQTVGSVGTIKRKVKVIVTTVHPTPVISSWQEVGSF
ncbi:MAG: hypothetical protein Q8R11_01605 [bacterium]|nr:hypothetical protein [bacterium]